VKVIIKDDNAYVLRFDIGEEVVQELLAFCGTERITAGWINMLGATNNVVLSYYNLATKQYEDHAIQEDLEVVGVVGNVGLLEGKPALHLHGTFADKDLKTAGGHIKSLIVSATIEVHLVRLAGVISRSYDSKTGLNLMG
jgi:predicted DNA-binding protein with PD1-like motif